MIRKVLVSSVILLCCAGLLTAQTYFSPARYDFDAGRNFGDAHLTTLDVDGDGITDHAVVTLEESLHLGGNEQGAIQIFTGSYDGLFLVPPSVLNVPLDSFPGRVVGGDFDDDGQRDDFAVAVEDINGVAAGSNGGALVYTHAGGTFALFATLTAERADPGFTGIAADNLNGAGADDLVVISSRSDTFTVFLSTAGPGFDTGTTFSTCSTPAAVAIGDVNGVPGDDVVVACDPVGTGDQIVVYGNNGSGTFTPIGSPLEPATLADPRDLVLANLDNDVQGNLDLAVANSFLDAPTLSGTVTLLQGNGLGGFAEFTASGVPVGEAPVSIDAVDQNGDGIVDLLTANTRDEDISLLVGSLQGSQPLYIETFFVSGFPPVQAVFANLDGADSLDVLASNGNESSPTLSAFLGGGNDFVLRAPRFLSPAIRGANAVTGADFNRDGVDDFAVANAVDDSVSVFVSSPGTSSTMADFTLLDVILFDTRSVPFDVLAEDVDGNGYPDLLVLLSPTLGDGKVATFLNSGSAVNPFPSSPSFTDPVGTLPWTMARGNLDNLADAVQDIAVTNTGDQTVVVLRGLGGGDYDDAPLAVIDTTDGSPCFDGNEQTDCDPDGVALADVDGNGTTDMVVSRFGGADGGSLKVFINDGNGSFAPGQTLSSADPLGDPGNPRTVNHQTVFFGEIDGAGGPDIVAVGLAPDDYISVFLNDGSGNFSATPDSPFLLPAMDAATPDGPRNALLSDLNGDLLPDLAVAGFFSNNVAVAWGLGDGSFSSTLEGAQAFGTTQGPIAVAIGDFDGNGLLDLVAPGVSDDAALLFGCCNERPVAVAGGDSTGACGPGGQIVARLDGSASTDTDSTPGTNDDIEVFDWYEDFGTATESFLGTGEILHVELAPGPHLITLIVTDRVGVVDDDSISVTIDDGGTGDLTLVVSPSVLWPPNHRLVEVTVTVIVEDLCGSTGGSAILQSITSSEPDDAPGNGDGRTTGDIRDADVGAPDLTLSLRAERQGSGTGRVYTVTYTSPDGAQSASATVEVPHDQSGGPEPVSLNVRESATGTSVTWPEVPGASSYNVIRGDLSQVEVSDGTIHLGDTMCLVAAAHPSTGSIEDSGIPAPGDAFFYLIEYMDSSSSSYGTVSAPMERVVDSGGCGTSGLPQEP